MQIPNTIDRAASDYPIQPLSILEQNSVASFFEPIFSALKMGVVGLESLHRAVHPDSLQLIDPKEIFQIIGREDFELKIALDHLFRQKGLEDFSPFQIKSPNLFLFLKLEPSLLQEISLGSVHLLKQVQNLGLAPQQIVLGISLSSELDLQYVGKFMKIQHGDGFLLGLKDLTASSEHLDSILRFNPDMVQVKDSLIKGLARKGDQQRALRKITTLAHSLGILVIAGGLESEEDALVAMELGADLLKGKYFYHNPKAQTVLTLGRKSRMQFLAERYRRRLTRKAGRDRERVPRCKGIAECILNRLGASPDLGFESQFPSIFGQFPSLECLYLLDGEGLQVSEAVCSEFHVPERKRLLFQPSPKGSDHSLREYYYALLASNGIHVTKPYLSLNSGNFCVTASKMIRDPLQGDSTILCADLILSKV